MDESWAIATLRNKVQEIQCAKFKNLETISGVSVSAERGWPGHAVY